MPGRPASVPSTGRPGGAGPDFASAPRRLNLGCGFDHRAGFLNVDIDAAHRPDVLSDIRVLAGFPDAWFEEIVANDVLEHLPRTETVFALSTWNRVLVPGGRLRLRTTSLLGLLELFRHRDYRSLERQSLLVQCLFGTQASPADTHYTAFTEDLLRASLEGAGFRLAELATVGGWLFDASAVKSGDPADAQFARDSALAALDDPVTFVSECYRRILRRDPDPAGLAAHLANLSSGAVSRVRLIADFRACPEAATQR